ncbi:MAG: PAS domain-containing protein [Lachnospiraceae bacterium]|nr:PAS domain-containing protein [Lachnospiraceae bacterium]
MAESYEFFRDNIVKNMSEGILGMGFDGYIKYVNPAAINILGFTKEEMIDRRFASLFIQDSNNDDFVQTVLDSIYERDKVHQSIVPYYKGDKMYHLRVLSSYIVGSNAERLGVILVFSDLSEIMELRDVVKSMEEIRKLNSQLEMRNKLISETFGRFLSDDIVKHLLDTPDGLRLGGKKQQLTILMSDLRGFTAMSERMDAVDLISMLNHYLGEMTNVIQENKGTIIEFIGDGILAIFGAPDNMEDHANCALASALGMEARMLEINKWNAEHGYPELEMGIGINTGEVIVGNIGSEKRTKYGVVGSNVNLCGRIESYTVGGQVLISPATREQLTVDIEVAREMTVYPKGANGELILSHVTGMGAPYNIHVKLTENVPQHLERPIPVCMYLIEGKHGVAKAIYGGITAVAHDSAILETTYDFQIFDNIQINAGGKLFCKITDRTEGGYVLQYTSVPTGYPAWLKEARV